MEGDITGSGQTFPTEKRKEVIRVSARKGLSGETTIKDTRSGEVFILLEMALGASLSWTGTVPSPCAADCSQ